MGEYKDQLKRQRHEFLLTFFKQEKDCYEFKEVNGYILVKQWNGNTNAWEVAIYTKESFKNSGGREQTSPKPPDKQLPFPVDGGSLKTLQDVDSDVRPLPWEVQGETNNR